MNANLGFKFWVLENRLAINVMSTFKSGLDDTYSKDHFQHSAGLVFQFGGKDTDGDGINDDEDECPAVPGLKEFNGCPDTDGDGIEDAKDECPEVAVLQTLTVALIPMVMGLKTAKTNVQRKKAPWNSADVLIEIKMV